LLLGSGRIAGVSGIAGQLLLGARGDRAWRALFLLGLVASGLAFALFEPGVLGESPRSLAVIALAGLLVGVGTRLGSGCTSGHVGIVSLADIARNGGILGARTAEHLTYQLLREVSKRRNESAQGAPRAAE
jgi:hypothetical protein